MSAVYWARTVPDELRAHDTMIDPDYSDIFFGTVATPVELTPAWIRSVLSNAPARLRLALGLALLTQRYVLGLQLERGRTADHLIGWSIADRGDHWFRLEAASRLGRGHLVFHLDGRRLAMATFLRHDRWVGRLIWAPVSLGHRAVGLALVRYATTWTGSQESSSTAWEPPRRHPAF
jgi:hypothetical protein